MKKKRIWPKAVVIFVLILLLLLFLGYFMIKRYFPLEYQDIVQEMSLETGVSESLIYAVIHTESSFRPEVESHLGARGLMQLTEETYEWVKYRKHDTHSHYDDLFIPEQNIRYGVWLLGLLKDEFGTQTNTLSAYHAGWGNVKKWLKDESYAPDGKEIETIPFRDTAHYVHKVERAQKIYQILYQIY